MLANYLQIVITLAMMFWQVQQHLPNTETWELAFYKCAERISPGL